MTRESAWLALQGAAQQHTANPTPESASVLSQTAKDWSVASRPAAPAPSSDGPVIPFGRSKGTPVSAATTPDLEWVKGALERSIEDATKERWKADNVSLRDAILAELERR